MEDIHRIESTFPRTHVQKKHVCEFCLVGKQQITIMFNVCDRRDTSTRNLQCGMQRGGIGLQGVATASFGRDSDEWQYREFSSTGHSISKSAILLGIHFLVFADAASPRRTLLVQSVRKQPWVDQMYKRQRQVYTTPTSGNMTDSRSVFFVWKFQNLPMSLLRFKVQLSPDSPNKHYSSVRLFL